MKKLELAIPGVTGLLLTCVEDIIWYFEQLEEGCILSHDWETKNLLYNTRTLGLSLHARGHSPAFIPTNEIFPNGVPIKDVVRLCNKWFPKFRLIAQNAKFDSMINKMKGIEDENAPIFADTLVMIHLTNPELEKKLETRVKKDFGFEKRDFKEISGKNWDKINWYTQWEELQIPLACYGCEDIYFTTKLYYHYSKLMDAEAKKIHDKIEIPTMKVLRDAKIRGVLIDVPLLKDFEKRIEPAISECLESIYSECGCVFNVNSSKQKQEVFFDKMGLPVLSKTNTGGRSTDAKTFSHWADKGYEVGLLLEEYSQLNKLHTSYILSIPELCDEHNVLRGDQNSCGTKTGRLSSSDPNLQNQPNNDNFPIRKAFIPRPGYVFVNRDYSQLELRLMAHMSNERKLVKVFREGGDPHGDVAERLGIARKGAKVVNFGVIYGMGPAKLARTLGISEKDASDIINIQYMRTYSDFAKWKVETENFAKRYGYIKNLFGRIRQLPYAKMTAYSSGYNKQQHFSDLRRAVNTPIQGSGADIVKKATIDMVNEFKRRDLDAHFLLQVHDELLVECRYDIMFEVEEIMTQCMEKAVELIVPLTTEGKIITEWSEMKHDEILSLPQRYDWVLHNLLTA